MKPTASTTPLAIALALLLAGCGKSAETAAETQWPSPAAETATAALPETLPMPCTLVTADDAKAVIGTEVGEMANEQDACLWAGGDNPGAITMLMVQLIRADSAEESATLFDSLTGLSGNLAMAVNDAAGTPTRKSGQDIEGLGDAAWCSASNADLVGTQQVIVRSGTVLLTLNVTGMTKGERQASLCPKLEAAARQAFARLGGAP